jgi:hypothetical protein
MGVDDPGAPKTRGGLAPDGIEAVPLAHGRSAEVTDNVWTAVGVAGASSWP